MAWKIYEISDDVCKIVFRLNETKDHAEVKKDGKWSKNAADLAEFVNYEDLDIFHETLDLLDINQEAKYYIYKVKRII